MRHEISSECFEKIECFECDKLEIVCQRKRTRKRERERKSKKA